MQTSKTRKRFWILFLCLLLYSIVSFTNVEAKFIGHDGGEVNAGNGCKLIVQPGSIGSAEDANDAVEEAGDILEDLEEDTKDYIKSLTKIKKEIEKALNSLDKEGYKEAHLKIKKALKELKEAKETAEDAEELAKLEEAENELLAAQEALGLDITATSYCDTFEYEGETYEFLMFEFGPSGTSFSPPAMLVIPWSKILETDFMILHLSGEIVDLVDLGYEIDEENETVTFYIPGFSYYYFARR